MRGGLAAAAVTLALAAAAPAAGAPGDLDTGFGQGGFFTPDLGPQQASLFAVAPAPDGGLVFAGAQRVSGSDFDVIVVRSLAGGAIDPSFGPAGQGFVRVPITAGVADLPSGIAVAADGSIFVGGTSGGASRCLFVLKLDAAGARVNGFDGDGIRIVDVPGTTSELAGNLALDGAGRPLLAGGDGADFLVVRLDGGSGAPDPGFDGDGVVRGSTVAGAPIDGPALGLLGDRILVAGPAGPAGVDTSVIRLHGNGGVDSLFGDGGVAPLSLGPGAELVRTLAVDASGSQIAVGGHAAGAGGEPRPAVGAISAGGAPAFVFLPPPPFPAGEIAGLQFVPGIGWLSSGATTTADPDLFVLGLHPDGQVNAGFGAGGSRVFARPGEQFAGGSGVDPAAGGRVVIAGDENAATPLAAAVTLAATTTPPGAGTAPAAAPPQARLAVAKSALREDAWDETSAEIVRALALPFAALVPGARPAFWIGRDPDEAAPRPADGGLGLVDEEFTYNLVVFNHGDAAAEDVVLEDLLPAGFRVAGWSSQEFIPAPAPGGKSTNVGAPRPEDPRCRLAPGLFRCRLGTLAPGHAVRVELTGRWPAPGTHTNEVRALRGGTLDDTARHRAEWVQLDTLLARARARELSGTATAGPGRGLRAERTAVRLARVEVAVVRLDGRARGAAAAATRCRWLASTRGRFRTVAARRRRCLQPVWLRARLGRPGRGGRVPWTLRLRRALPRGRYVAYVRAIGPGGVAESSFSRSDGNRAAFRVR